MDFNQGCAYASSSFETCFDRCIARATMVNGHTDYMVVCWAGCSWSYVATVGVADFGLQASNIPPWALIKPQCTEHICTLLQHDVSHTEFEMVPADRSSNICENQGMQPLSSTECISYMDSEMTGFEQDGIHDSTNPPFYSRPPGCSVYDPGKIYVWCKPGTSNCNWIDSTNWKVVCKKVGHANDSAKTSCVNTCDAVLQDARILDNTGGDGVYQYTTLFAGSAAVTQVGFASKYCAFMYGQWRGDPSTVSKLPG